MEIIDKPWGHEEVIYRSERGTLKRLHITVECRTSLQYHQQKLELCTVEKGRIAVSMGRGVEYCTEGDIMLIPFNTPHRYLALEDDAVILEFSTNSDDTDIIRLEDDYGRV